MLFSVVIPTYNRLEMLMYAGRRDVRRALDRWRAAPRPIIVKLGAAGSCVVGGGIEIRAAAPPVRAVDSTGAGDAFDAGFLAAWLEGRAVRDCVALGIACGALSTARCS